ncbi:MAG: hypothetical protein CMP07_09540 [Xanthomonadales bacterium]|nr:hypothetical protein [Xanthomonadales bacterium]
MVGCWLLVVGCWLLVVGCWLLVRWFAGWLGLRERRNPVVGSQWSVVGKIRQENQQPTTNNQQPTTCQTGRFIATQSRRPWSRNGPCR